MINFDEITGENKKEHNQNWSYIPDHLYRILIIGGSGSEKTNTLLNLINYQPDTDNISTYAKDPYEAKYKFLIKEREKVGLHYFNDPKAFTEYSNDIQDVYKNIEVLIVFDDTVADTIGNKKLDSTVIELFMGGKN